MKQKHKVLKKVARHDDIADIYMEKNLKTIRALERDGLVKVFEHRWFKVVVTKKGWSEVHDNRLSL